MANLSKIRRENLISFIEELKQKHNDDESIRAFNEIENQLRERKFGLVWEEHSEEIDDLLENNIPILTEDISKRIFSSEELHWNFLIEGDNLQALNVLKKTHKGNIDIIYIDPPYNTGNQDWKYNNNYVDDNDTFRHSKWLSMMYRRLIIAKSLLKKDGALICAIDDNEQPNLMLILNEIFGAAYDINCVTVVHNPRGTQADKFSYVSEYAIFVTPKSHKVIAKKQADEEDVSWRSLRRTGDESLRSDAKNCFFPIYVKDNVIIGFGDVCDDNFHPSKQCEELSNGTLAIYPIDPNGIERKWGYARQTIEDVRDQLICKKTKNGLDIYIGYLYVTQRTVWDSPLYDANAYGTQLLGSILTTSFPFPKSLHLVKDCIKAIVHRKDAIILDFFAGSGTTGHAVMDLNKEDGGSRRFILSTNNQLSAIATLEYLNANGILKNYIPTKRSKATAIENKINDYLQEHPDIKESLFGSDAAIDRYHEYGICRGVTYQRLKTLITGIREDGTVYSTDKMSANLKYLKCAWTPRKPDDYLLSNALCLHVKELIELQTGKEIDGTKHVLILSRNDFKKAFQNEDCVSKIESVWVNENIVFSAVELLQLKSKNFKYIPREYFSQELKEVGEYV